MKIRFNENEEVVNTVKEGLKRTGGYCPCRISRTEDFKCMCKEFRMQYEGLCHCGLFEKYIEEINEEE